MVGSDKERARADRLTGLIADAVAAENAGFTSFWMPQVPGYLDAMTAVALIGQATDASRSARPWFRFRPGIR
jgi:alkanesulfonate monooxygenase SsuD/methylene tetrahydromethanopterin reductase-like flavin-dependent oxidoreductase (luciferase family)